MPSPYEAVSSYGKTSETLPHGWSSLVGIVTAIVGNVLISFALNTQRYAHIRIDKEFRNKQNPDAKSARKHLPKSLRNYGTAVQQEQAAEERQRINEEAEIPEHLNSHVYQEQEVSNGKQHEDDEEHDEEHDVQRTSYLKSPWWWLGIVLMTIGEAGNFLAYGFAPASIVSPLGVVALISNCLIAPLMLKETFRQRDLWGVLIAIGGAVTVVLSAKTSEKKLGPDTLWQDVKRWEFLTYVLITAVFIVVLMLLSPKYGSRTILVDLGLVGLFGGYTALSTKGVASLLSVSLYRAFEYPIFYVLILVLVTSAIMQIRYLNRALQNFASTQVIPVQFVIFTLSVIVGSAVLYRDFEKTDVDHALKFIFGCLLTFSGVYLITSGRKNGDDEDDFDEIVDHGVERIRLLDEEACESNNDATKQESDLQIDTTNLRNESTRPQFSRQSSAIPSIAVTPAVSTNDLNHNPFISSTDHLARYVEDIEARPQTPQDQTIPAASSSNTQFFTPDTTSQNTLKRVVSTPAQPQTPKRRAISPAKLSREDLSTLKRSSISRLLPGPLLQPWSSGSLSGIIADRILKGEGGLSPSPTLRRHRSNREGPRPRNVLSVSGGNDLDSAIPSAFDSDGSVHRKGLNARAHTENTPLIKRTTSYEAGQVLGTSFKSTKGRLRSMSETFSNLLSGRRGSIEDDERDRQTDSSPTR